MKSPNEYFSERASVRNFDEREISDKLLNSILQRATKAPTTGNMQLYSVIVNRDTEMLKEVAAAHFNQPAAVNSRILLTVCADFHRFTRWCDINHADAGFDNLLSFSSAMIDAVIYAQQIVTIAEMEGLGTCYLGTVTYNAPEISEILSLPDMVVPVACIALGWPEKDGETTERLPLQAIRHDERYHDYSDSEITELFKAKDNYPPNAVFVKENKKENLAQVFAEVRYPRAMNEEFSEKFLKLLKQKNFLKI